MFNHSSLKQATFMIHEPEDAKHNLLGINKSIFQYHFVYHLFLEMPLCCQCSAESQLTQINKIENTKHYLLQVLIESFVSIVLSIDLFPCVVKLGLNYSSFK